MTGQEIKSNLCAYDPRNPNYYYNEEWGIGHKEKPTDCKCDNCFYGRDKLANELLKYREAQGEFYKSLEINE